MNRKRFYLVVPLVMILATILVGVNFRFKVPDCGITSLRCIEDLQNHNIKLNYAWNLQDESGIINSSFGNSLDKYSVDSADIIAVVAPTGNIDQTEGSLGQEFIVKKIIRGDNFISNGQTSYVYQYFGFRAVDQHIEFLNTLNIMYPGNDYLIFMDSSPLNIYSSEMVYVLKSEYFGYVKIDHLPTPSLKGDYKEYEFSELKAYEFFSTSNRISETLNHARVELLNKYFTE